MNRIVPFLLLLVCGTAHAETYAVRKQDGGVAILNYFDGQDSLEQVKRDAGYGNRPHRLIRPEELPPRADRKYWQYVANGSLTVDLVAKQADIDAENTKQAQKQAILDRLGITRQELRAILRGEDR